MDFINGVYPSRVTTDGIFNGLPYYRTRTSSVDTHSPTLLFFNLEQSVSTSNSTADKVIELIHNQGNPLLPIFGCGKTRTAIEILSRHWGFYFNASGTDFGSGDLAQFINSTTDNRYRSSNQQSNNNIHILTLALLLARIMILDHTIKLVSNSNSKMTKRGFLPLDWMKMQVSPHSVLSVDLFKTLFTLIVNKIHNNQILKSEVEELIQTKFSDLQTLIHGLRRQKFINNRYKILIIIDEAQTLGNNDPGSIMSGFISEMDNTISQPLLSPFMHGIYMISANDQDYGVIPCGTGLSVFDMKWLADSASWVKGNADRPEPFTDFGGWASLGELTKYCNSLKNHLSLRMQKLPLIYALHKRLKGNCFEISMAGSAQ
ncbi:hypothetical protein BGZ80_006055 [Entomortierella chlamydospora]|uniref:Uncharacterized protein n=1 Tax=Entomortierella chlamydospora TaxID=101097 RepID=A0A9P6SU46_9FUNG|nr:hypothetical protein BGZ80_006055 [Entomortierella chlamydospora]